jgi:hypothetical protein
MNFPKISDTTGVRQENEETPPAAAEQEVTQNPEAATPEPETEVPAAEETSPNQDETATEEVAGGAESGNETETREASELTEDREAETKPEEGKSEEPQPPASDDFKRSLESRIYQESGGKIKDVDGFLEYTKKLGEMYNELANKKPSVNAETIQEINKKLQEEKGYSLSEALMWQEKDIKSMPTSDKLLWSMKAEDEVGHTDAWYQQKLSKFEVLDKPESEIQEMIEDEQISAKEIEDLRVERDDMLHRADKILEKYKQSFDLNVNFDPKPSAEADEQRRLAEEQKAAEARAAISESLKSFDKVEFEVNLINDLGDHKIAIPVSDADKHDLLDTEDRHFLNKWYGGKDGKFDFQTMQKHLYQGRNTDKIVQQAVTQALAEAEKRRIAKKDNVQVDKERRAATPEGKSPYSQVASRLAEKFGRS